MREAGYAQNGIAAIAYAARAWLDGQPHDAAWAAKQVYEAADFAAQTQMDDGDVFSPEVEDALRSAPVVQTALGAITADLDSAERGRLAELQTNACDAASAFAALCP